MGKRNTEFQAMERGIILALMLARGDSITTRLIRERFSVSAATAKRDLLMLEVTARANAVVKEHNEVTLRLTPNVEVSGAGTASA